MNKKAETVTKKLIKQAKERGHLVATGVTPSGRLQTAYRKSKDEISEDRKRGIGAILGGGALGVSAPIIISAIADKDPNILNQLRHIDEGIAGGLAITGGLGALGGGLGASFVEDYKNKKRARDAFKNDRIYNPLANLPNNANMGKKAEVVLEKLNKK